jgi:hypothetical protein
MNKLIYSQQNMIMFFLFLLITLQGCKKEEETTTTTNSNKTIVKYEIISPVATIPDSTLGSTGTGPLQSLIFYANGFSNGSGGLGAVPKNISYSVWTKEVDITSEARPFGALLSARGYVPVTSGFVAFNIYVNGVLKANFNIPIKSFNGSDSLGIFDTLGSLTYIID